jgi:hypothetical protein
MLVLLNWPLLCAHNDTRQRDLSLIIFGRTAVSFPTHENLEHDNSYIFELHENREHNCDNHVSQYMNGARRRRPKVGAIGVKGL